MNGISVHVIAGGQAPGNSDSRVCARHTEDGRCILYGPNWKLSSALFGRVEDDFTNCYTVSYRSRQAAEMEDIDAS